VKFFNNLFRRPDKFIAPQSVNDALPYLEGFAQAVRFTQSLGFDTNELKLGETNANALDPKGNFVDAVFAAAQVNDRTQAAGQCLKWCHYLQPYFERQLGRRVILTIGQLWNKDVCVFGPDFEDLNRWVRHGLQIDDFGAGGGFKLHAWLTVETGEIIEPTLLSSLAAFGGSSFRKFAGATVWGRDPHVLNGHRYVPLALGNELVEQIGKRSFVQLLASGPDELVLQAYAVLAPT
jgi:hypothetical protein